MSMIRSAADRLWNSLHFGRYRPVDRIRLIGAPFLVEGGWILANRVGQAPYMMYVRVSRGMLGSRGAVMRAW